MPSLPSMTGSDVAGLLAKLGVHPRRVTSDSRAVTPGAAFAAYPGHVHDGRTFIAGFTYLSLTSTIPPSQAS